MRALTHLLLLTLLVCANLSAQVFSVPQAGVQQFQSQHPGARFSGALFYQRQGLLDEAGNSSMIYGSALSVGATPLESAENHLFEVRGFLADEIGTLEPEVRPDGSVILGAMWDRETQTHRFSTFRFSQVYNGIPVFRSGVGFLVRNEPSHPLVMSTFDVKDLADLKGTVGAGPASRRVSAPMVAAARRLLDEQLLEGGRVPPSQPPTVESSEGDLVIWAGTDSVPAQPRLALKFFVTRGSVFDSPELYQRYFILASIDTGEVLYSEDQVLNFEDMAGTVSGRATDGLNALECDPETQIPLPYVEASIVGGNTVFTDVNGQFVIPHGGTSSVTVRSRLRGQYFEVFDEAAGSAIPEVSLTATPPGPAHLVHNPTPNVDFSTAAVNAYVEANVVRDYSLFYAPTFPTIGTQAFFDLNVNINSTCNAFYDGASLNMFRSGGGCNNTSFSDVVHHEYGHHLVNVTGNGQGQFGEGAGDCMGVLIQDEPILGQGFRNCGVGIRNADNTHQYPCSGGIHDCGQLISGCIWSLRNELIVTEPASYRDIGAALFLNMLIVRGQMQPGNSTIDPTITVIYLELDDDDADIGNGTPHYIEIANAFGSHNMDAPQLNLLDFVFPTGRPDLVAPAGGAVEFTVEVIGVVGTPAPGTGVLYVDRGNGVESFAMSQASDNVYEVVFPTFSCGSNPTYYFSAETVSGQTVLNPSDAPAVRYEAVAADSLTVSFADDFETNLGWGVSGNASDGQWSRGVPAGGGDRGDPPTDGDGSGACYLTDNVDGNSDVDGGSTLLTSPVLDAGTGGSGAVPLISYHRWYSNDFGATQDDIFVVELSNNGGATWVTLETVGPAGPETSGGWFERTFQIADFLAPTSNMRIRFTASDLGDGSIVEAGVDGVRIQLAECAAGIGTNFCDANPNSTGGAATITATGSTIVALNDVTLTASDMPVNQFGYFLSGPGNGSLAPATSCGVWCLNGGDPALLGRYSGDVFNSGPSGTGSLSIDLTQVPIACGPCGTDPANYIYAIQPGDTWNFQAWYRDTQGCAQQNNFTDAVSITFQ